MNNQLISVEKLLSKQTIEKLDAALTKGNMEQLKKQMERLFSFKNIFNMHDDHIIELAECIVDLASSDNIGDILEIACDMEKYAKRRILQYQKRKNKLIKEIEWVKVKKNMDEMSMLDLTYRLWVYEFGFEYSKYHMYTMLCRIIHTIQEYKKEGT